MDKMFDAIEFAHHAHKGQLRKGCKSPYIIHPIAVMDILLRYGHGEEIAIAGVLHDVVEDTEFTLEDIKEKFGSEIAYFVDCATEPEDDYADWESRKEHTIDFIKNHIDKNCLYLICADKFHNLLSISQDLELLGDCLWERFNRGYEKQKWYYQSLADAFMTRYEAEEDKLFLDFSNMVESVFGSCC